MLMSWMVVVDGFGEINVEILKDKILIGRVRIEK